MSTKSSSKKNTILQTQSLTTRNSTTTSKSPVTQSISKHVNLLQHRLMNIQYQDLNNKYPIENIISKHISDYVVMDKTPHFSIVSIKKDQESAKNIYLEEIHDGTFDNFIQSNDKLPLFKNMIEQLMISILTLHHFGIRKYNFDDLDLKQITFRKTSSTNTNSYFHYKIFQKDYYVKDLGFLWIFSTLNELEENHYDKLYITTNKFEEDDEEDFEDEYSKLFELILNLEISNKMKTIIQKLQNVKNETIETLDSEVKFFENILKSELLFHTDTSNINNMLILNKGNPYSIHKTKMTFSKPIMY